MGFFVSLFSVHISTHISLGYWSAIILFAAVESSTYSDDDMLVLYNTHTDSMNGVSMAILHLH